MMKAIFEKEFLELSERIDNTLELTNYVIGSRYSGGTNLDNEFIKNLFNGSYILSDTRKTNLYPLNSIWEKNDKLLRIYIEIAESEKEKLVEPTNEYDFIYCYAKYPNGEEKIAIIILNLSEDGTTLLPLDLNISCNLIELKFPSIVVSTIKNTMDSDTEFLEGIGVESGVNMFNNSVLDKKDQLVAKDSYYKYIRNTLSGGESISLSYNNINGEKVYSNSFRKIYKSITLSSLGTVDSLSASGGYIKLLGEVVYDVYKCTNTYKSVLYSQNESCDIINFPFIDILITDNTGITIEKIFKDKKKIKYGQNMSGEEQHATVKLRITNTDGSIVESELLTLTQKNQ